MIETGKVIGVRKEKATVGFPPRKACGGCGKCALGQAGRQMLIETINDAGAEIGDRVEVEIPTRDPLRGAFILFGLPVLGLLAGAGAGYLIFPADGRAGDAGAVLIGAALMTVVFILVRRRENRRAKKDENLIRIIRVRERARK